jgi:hypothetical protein
MAGHHGEVATSGEEYRGGTELDDGISTVGSYKEYASVLRESSSSFSGHSLNISSHIFRQSSPQTTKLLSDHSPASSWSHTLPSCSLEPQLPLQPLSFPASRPQS